MKPTAWSGRIAQPGKNGQHPIEEPSEKRGIETKPNQFSIGSKKVLEIRL
ncbi:MAG: hypothetical protein MZV70_46020 [Desulfobacterales bacterium]|nr:hypothetical protein [Desulfobacterales bacterium]